MGKNEEFQRAEVIEYPSMQLSLPQKTLSDKLGDFFSEMTVRSSDIDTKMEQVRENVGRTQDLLRKAADLTEKRLMEAEQALNKTF